MSNHGARQTCPELNHILELLDRQGILEPKFIYEDYSNSNFHTSPNLELSSANPP